MSNHFSKSDQSKFTDICEIFLFVDYLLFKDFGSFREIWKINNFKSEFSKLQGFSPWSFKISKYYEF